MVDKRAINRDSSSYCHYTSMFLASELQFGGKIFSCEEGGAENAISLLHEMESSLTGPHGRSVAEPICLPVISFLFALDGTSFLNSWNTVGSSGLGDTVACQWLFGRRPNESGNIRRGFSIFSPLSVCYQGSSQGTSVFNHLGFFRPTGYDLLDLVLLNHHLWYWAYARWIISQAFKDLLDASNGIGQITYQGKASTSWQYCSLIFRW